MSVERLEAKRAVLMVAKRVVMWVAKLDEK